MVFFNNANMIYNNHMDSKTITHGISWSFAEKLLTEFVSSIIAIVLARLLLPEDYGLVSIVQIFISITSIFVSSGLGTSLVQNKNANEEQISTVFYLNVLIGIILYILLFSISPLIARLYKNDQLTSLIRALALKIPLVSIYNVQHAYVQKNMKFKLFFFSSLIGTIMAGIIGIILANKGYGAWALIFATLTDQIIDIIVLFLTTRWIPSFRLNIKETKSMIGFGRKVLMSDIVTKIYNEIKSLIIGIKYSTSDLAFDTKGKKFSAMPIEITNSSIRRVMFPVFSNIQDDKAEVKRISKSSISIMTFFIAPMLIGLASTSNNFVSVVLTNNWVGCIPYLQIYCFTSLLNPVFVTDIQIMQAYGEGNKLLKINIISTIIDILTIFLTIYIFDDPVYLALETVFITLVQMIMYNKACKRIIDFGIKEHLLSIKNPLLLSATMGLVVYFIGNYNIYSQLVTFIVQILSGIVIYVSLNLLFKTQELMYIINYFRNKRSNEIKKRYNHRY